MINFIHSDCLDIEKIDNVGLIITDPPYFVIPKGKTTTKGKDNFTWDNFKDLDDFLSFTEKWFQKYYNMKNNDSFMYIFWSQKYLLEGLNLSERTYHCEECNFTIDRDLNASINILNVGLKQIEATAAASGTSLKN